ncbi:MAG: hypothetical protein EBS39_11935, partial [Gammaproteobacteria bacterium]|nr:hypothetical protein [Gammaproteobacteria bacterium]
ERWRRRVVGVAAVRAEGRSMPLLGEAYYLEKALAPYSEVRIGPIDALLAQPPSMLIMPDSGAVPEEAAKAVRAEGQRGKSARNRRKKAARAAKAAARTAQAPTGDEPADTELADELADAEPAADELADELADAEPADAEPADDEPADDEPAADEPADDESADGLADEFDQVTVLAEDSGVDLGDE